MEALWDQEMEKKAERAETLDRESKILALREMESQTGWKLYQAHLRLLCRRKETVKAASLRADKSFEAAKQQFEIDGINLAVNELSKMITALKSPQGEEQD